jgi:hypothetical protein
MAQAFMSLSEQQIAQLIFRVIAKEIRPEELSALQEDWLDASDANREKLDELARMDKLQNKLRDYYKQNRADSAS